MKRKIAYVVHQFKYLLSYKTLTFTWVGLLMNLVVVSEATLPMATEIQVVSASLCHWRRDAFSDWGM
jgi:hypothetical protein